MERYSEVIGLPVVCINNGKKSGVVKDIIFDTEEKKVKALLIDTGGYKIGKKVLLYENIRKLGRDAVIVDDSSNIVNISRANMGKKLVEAAKQSITGLRIYTRTGDDLGVVQDILFNENSGLIEEVEISDGILQDILLGRNILPLFGKVEFGEESIIVDREAIDEMANTGGGLKNKILGQEDNI